MKVTQFRDEFVASEILHVRGILVFYVLNSDGSIQFQYNTGKELLGTPALGNLDEDSDLEIIIGSFASPTSSNKLYALNPDGSDVDGFPVTIGEKILRGAALADFDNNGKSACPLPSL